MGTVRSVDVRSCGGGGGVGGRAAVVCYRTDASPSELPTSKTGFLSCGTGRVLTSVQGQVSVLLCSCRARGWTFQAPESLPATGQYM
jgi:hypothetical protein